MFPNPDAAVLPGTFAHCGFPLDGQPERCSCRNGPSAPISPGSTCSLCAMTTSWNIAESRSAPGRRAARGFEGPIGRRPGDRRGSAAGPAEYEGRADAGHTPAAANAAGGRGASGWQPPPRRPARGNRRGLDRTTSSRQEDASARAAADVFPLLHRPADLRQRHRDRHDAGRRRLAVRPADRAVSGDHAADGAVTADYPGANAQTSPTPSPPPIEQQVNGVENMLYMSSTSSSDGATRSRSPSTSAPISTTPRCSCKTAWRSPSPSCPRKSAARASRSRSSRRTSSSSSRSPRPTTASTACS